MAMTKCRDCGAKLSSKAVACPGCGAPAKQELSGCAALARVGGVGCLGVLLITGLFVVGMILIAFSSGDRPAKTQRGQSAPPDIAVVQPTPAAPGSQWHYLSSADPMGNAPSYEASIRSSNMIEFKFPYGGPQRATLALRTHPRHGKDVILTIERGQFLCPSYKGCNVLVRFDDGTAATYSAAGAADNSTDVIFIRNYSRFVGAMSKATRVRVSAEVYQEGAPIFDFDVAGFDRSRYLGAK